MKNLLFILFASTQFFGVQAMQKEEDPPKIIFCGVIKDKKQKKIAKEYKIKKEKWCVLAYPYDEKVDIGNISIFKFDLNCIKDYLSKDEKKGVESEDERSKNLSITALLSAIVMKRHKNICLKKDFIQKIATAWSEKEDIVRYCFNDFIKEQYKGSESWEVGKEDFYSYLYDTNQMVKNVELVVKNVELVKLTNEAGFYKIGCDELCVLDISKVRPKADSFRWPFSSYTKYLSKKEKKEVEEDAEDFWGNKARETVENSFSFKNRVFKSPNDKEKIKKDLINTYLSYIAPDICMYNQEKLQKLLYNKIIKGEHKKLCLYSHFIEKVAKAWGMEEPEVGHNFGKFTAEAYKNNKKQGCILKKQSFKTYLLSNK